MSSDNNNGTTWGRRRFMRTLGTGTAGLTALSAGLVSPAALGQNPTTGLSVPGAANLARFPDSGPWNMITDDPFGGFDFALGYVAEGVDGADPEQANSFNPTGLFESHRDEILNVTPSAVGGNETPNRSSEFWYRDILGFSNQAIADDLWAFINYMRRLYGVDLDDPASDGFELPDGSTVTYVGSPDPNDELSLFGARYGIGRIYDNGQLRVPSSYQENGYVRMTQTLLAPNVGYTVVFRSGRAHPNYNGGTTGVTPEDPGKVRDGGVWGGTFGDFDALPHIHGVRTGQVDFTAPEGVTKFSGPKWGQFWRRVADLEEGVVERDRNQADVIVDGLDPGTPVADRPAPRGRFWHIGFLPSGTDYFWGHYNLLFGESEETVTIHYRSEIPTRFADSDGLPKTFACELTAHSAGTDMPQSQSEQGFRDLTGELSGFADTALSTEELSGFNPFGLGRVHGTSVQQGRRASDGRATFHLRNWLLFPPRLNSDFSINDNVPGKGPLSFGSSL